MKRYSFPLISILIFVSVLLHAQIRLEDSIKLVTKSNYHDTTKIDKLNDYIFRYSTFQPEITLMYSDTAIKLASKIQDSVRLAVSFGRKGIAYYYLGDYSGALESYFTAIRIKESIGDYVSVFREYNNVGLALRNLNQITEALYYFQLTLELIGENPNKQYEALVWNNIGISHRGAGEFDAAMEALEKAFSINSEINALQGKAHNLNNIGNVLYDQNKASKATDYYSKARVINKKLNNRYEEAQTLNNLGRAFLSLKDFDSAIGYLNEAENIIKDIQTEYLLLTNYDIKSKYYHKTGNTERALAYRNKYSELRDSIYFINRSKQFEQLKNIANTEKEIQRLEFLEQINAMQREKINAQLAIQIGGLFFIAFILVILFIFYRNNRVVRNLNSSLKNHSHKVESLNEELHAANQELNIQAENLKYAFAKLQNAQKQLIQSEKMASLGVLAGGVAHEINNPLNFIYGSIIILERKLKTDFNNDTEIASLLEMMHSGVKRVSGIVSGLSHYSRREGFILRECNIHLIINNCLLMLGNTTKDRINVTKEFTSEPFSLLCSEGEMHQALLNILSNAVDAIDGKGSIEIITNIADNKLLVSVKDTGCGISEENLPKITDPFFTTKDPGKGTGLGLSITHNVIEEHQGSIEFSSKINAGTTVLVKLPL